MFFVSECLLHLYTWNCPKHCPPEGSDFLQKYSLVWGWVENICEWDSLMARSQSKNWILIIIGIILFATYILKTKPFSLTEPYFLLSSLLSTSAVIPAIPVGWPVTDREVHVASSRAGPLQWPHPWSVPGATDPPIIPWRHPNTVKFLFPGVEELLVMVTEAVPAQASVQKRDEVGHWKKSLCCVKEAFQTRWR